MKIATLSAGLFVSLTVCLTSATAVAETLPDFPKQKIELPSLSLSGLARSPATLPSQVGTPVVARNEQMISEAPSPLNDDKFVFTPDANVDYKLRIKAPDASVDYRLIVKNPDSFGKK